MNWRSLVAVGSVVAFAGIVMPSAQGATGGEQTTATERKEPVPVSASAAPASETLSETDKAVQNIKNPTSWFRWGADLRLREEYIKNARGLENDQDDTINMFRIRPRVWFELGPFFKDETVKADNGLSFYVRLTDETRIFLARSTTGLYAGMPSMANPVSADEIIPDNLYMEWKRIGGGPIDIKIGRQDLTYGRGWLILDGTPLDGSRSIYSDAAKLTVHFDDIKTDVDFFAVDNVANEAHRLGTIQFDSPAKYTQFMSDYDTKLLGVYLKSFYFKPAEINLYYIYKDDTVVDVPIFQALDPNGRIVHTVGGLVQGPFLDDPKTKTWDYYLEAAYQWGTEGAIPGVTTEATRQSFGLTSELGYTFQDAAWTPRVHAGYEYLSGDSPHTNTWEGWDPVLSRWPQSSELFVYRWEFEGTTGLGPIGAWSNMHRISAGASVNPIPRMTLSLDYNYMLADYHSFSATLPGTVAYGGGSTRGQLIVAKLLYDFNKYVSGHLWAEYFIPGGYYASGADNAVFLRWELTFKF